MKLNFSKNGFSCCGTCDTKILFKNPDQTLNLDNYREVSFLTSINSIMTVGFCPICREKVVNDPQFFQRIMDSVKEGWILEQIHEGWTDEQKQKYQDGFGNIEIVNFYHGNPDVGKNG